MGRERITAVIDALQALGIRADRGYPGKGMPYPDAPVVAVSLQEQTAEKLTLAVRVYCTVEFGGIVCEDLSMDIVPILEGQGAACTVETCSFDGKSGLFSIPIYATWVTVPAAETAFSRPPQQPGHPRRKIPVRQAPAQTRSPFPHMLPVS